MLLMLVHYFHLFCFLHIPCIVQIRCKHNHKKVFQSCGMSLHDKLSSIPDFTHVLMINDNGYCGHANCYVTILKVCLEIDQ